MPTPTKPITLGAKDALLTAGTFATFRNLSRSGKVTKEGSSGEAVASGADWEEGDKISITISGRYNSSVAMTVARGGVRKVFSLSEDTSTPAINL